MRIILPTVSEVKERLDLLDPLNEINKSVIQGVLMAIDSLSKDKWR
jgi:hypothetical protein